MIVKRVWFCFVEARATVDCVVQLKSPISILIGACHDHYLRFWKVPETTLLCSCKYISEHQPVQAQPAGGMHQTGQKQEDTDDVDKDILSVLTINSEAEDILIGGYDNGIYMCALRSGLLCSFLCFPYFCKRRRHQSLENYNSEFNYAEQECPDFGTGKTGTTKV